VPVPSIESRSDLLQAFLSDAAHVPGGFAAGLALPRDLGELAALVAHSRRVLPIGAQSSLTGGATPRGEVIISTRALNEIAVGTGDTVRAGAGLALADLQRTLASRNLYYPPVPTFDGAFVGGTIATNAAGAATFKYGSTRDWVEGITVVLADGSILSLRRGDVTASADGSFEIVRGPESSARVPVPAYRMPDVPKLSAGYFAKPAMDLIDLFIGSEGTLGVIAEATLRVIPRPRRAVALAVSRSDAQAIAITGALRGEAAASWRGKGPLDVAAIEYIDAMALAQLPDDAFSRAGLSRPDGDAGMLIVQIEVAADESGALERFAEVLESCGCGVDPVVAAPGDDRAAARLFELREAVPSAVNARVAAAKASIHPDIQKTAGDMIVPFSRMAECLALYRESFERRHLPYAIWGHLSDGNLHPNVVPGSLDDVIRGREALLEIAKGVMAMGGSPLAEHGVGRSPLKQRMLHELYGDDGIEAMRAVKRTLDPSWKLSPGVLFPEP
jgi:D-lactate dehydrogenase (cytochrome)